MIICNYCGTPRTEALSFCSECGAPAINRADYPTTPASGMTEPTETLNIPHAEASAGSGRKSNVPRTVMLSIGGVLIGALAIVVVLAVRSSLSSRSTESVAASLRNAVQNGRLVTLSGDDAYSYYFQLRTLDPQHRALNEVKSQVLPQLRSLGDDVFRKRVSLSLEIVTERDWTIAQRAYEWAHILEPGDHAIEARQIYADANVARLQGRREEAKNKFYTASRLDPSWGVVQNDLGYLHALDKGYSAALPFYQTAINLQGDWDIPYNGMGTAYYYLRNYDAAEAWYRKATEVNAQWATPHAWLGSIYENRRYFEAAIQEYQTALNLYNSSRDRIDTAELQTRITSLQQKIVP